MARGWIGLAEGAVFVSNLAWSYFCSRSLNGARRNLHDGLEEVLARRHPNKFRVSARNWTARAASPTRCGAASQFFMTTCLTPGASCDPCMTVATCEDTANVLGLSLGTAVYPFAGSYTIRGCYYYATGQYANTAFFGTGGSISQMRSTLGANTFRPTCLVVSSPPAPPPPPPLPPPPTSPPPPPGYPWVETAAATACAARPRPARSLAATAVAAVAAAASASFASASFASASTTATRLSDTRFSDTRFADTSHHHRRLWRRDLSRACMHRLLRLVLQPAARRRIT